MKKYHTENEISELVTAFETGTVSREGWKHAEHLVVALHYLSENDYETAYHKMREGIFNLLKAFEVDLTKEMPYHETLTAFWLTTVENFRREKNGYSLVKICSELTEKFDKDYPLKFYTRELLFSDEARKEFIKGDIA